jgi:type I restriction enzyme S subunit
MSRLNKLIAELCPDGVKYKTIRDIVKQNIGGGTPSKANPNYWNGAIPWASVKDLIYNGLSYH